MAAKLAQPARRLKAALAAGSCRGCSAEDFLGISTANVPQTRVIPAVPAPAAPGPCPGEALTAVIDGRLAGGGRP